MKNGIQLDKKKLLQISIALSDFVFSSLRDNHEISTVSVEIKNICADSAVIVNVLSANDDVLFHSIYL